MQLMPTCSLPKGSRGELPGARRPGERAALEGRRGLAGVKGRLAENHKSLWLVRAIPACSRGARAILEDPPKWGGGTHTGCSWLWGDKHPPSLDYRWECSEGERP